MVEHNLAKVGVASSSLVSRSILSKDGSFEILICWESNSSLPVFSVGLAVALEVMQ